MSEPSPQRTSSDLHARNGGGRTAPRRRRAAAQFAMSISLSMPPLLLPRSTEASWFGASSLDEDAALAKISNGPDDAP